MNAQGGPTDSLYSSLNPLVSDGTLTPHQADRVYRAVNVGAPAYAEAEGFGSPAAASGWQRPRLAAAGAILAAGLLGTAFAEASVVTGQKGFDWKMLVVLVAVTLLLGAASAGAFLLLHGRLYATWLAGALGALALASLAFSLIVLWDPDAFVYVAAVLMLAGGVAGYWFLKGQLFAVVAVVGGALLLGQIFSDVLSGGSSDNSSDVLLVGIGYLVFGLVVAAAGWRFDTRHVLGVIGIGISLTAMALVIYVNATLYAFSRAFAGTGSIDDGSSSSLSSVRSDIRVAMILGLIVAILAALAHAHTGYVGFAILAFLGAAVIPVSAIASLQTQHPLRWAGAFLVVGGLALFGLLGMQVVRRPKSSPPPPPGWAGPEAGYRT
ncbi:MAG: hypothetical protein ABJA81_13485 [Nocardioidaceae bacterium]